MNTELIEKLNKGITLESCNKFIPWKTDFDEIKKFINTELLLNKDKSSIFWENEKILNVQVVNLTISKQEFKNLEEIHGYLREEDFNKTKINLDFEFEQEGKYKKINSLEFKYTWKLEKVKIILSQRDRFGIYYEISIKYRNKWF